MIKFYTAVKRKEEVVGRMGKSLCTDEASGPQHILSENKMEDRVYYTLPSLQKKGKYVYMLNKRINQEVEEDVHRVRKCWWISTYHHVKSGKFAMKRLIMLWGQQYAGCGVATSLGLP